jgi:hypothetical protein
MQKITLEILDERLTSFFRENKEDHQSIIDQTTKTNGRVSDHEAWINKTKGAMTIIEVLLIPIVLYITYNILDKFF